MFGEGENQQESIVILNGSRKQVRVGGSGAPTMTSDTALRERHVRHLRFDVS